MNIYAPFVISDMQGPCPNGFHVPTKDEWQAIYDAGVSLGAWTSSNSTNFATYLKLPMAGFRHNSNLSFNDRGSYGYYWSSTSSHAYIANSLKFDASDIYPQSASSRSVGLTVRCLKDSPTVPTSSWTKLYGTSIESGGIFHNSTDGLISLSSDGSTWYTIMDKNLGATTVYNYGDTLTEANCGKIYQRGNNYGFSGDANYDTSKISQSSTQVNVTGYGPGNYYESSTWITTNPRQNSASNGNNLRGGVSQGTTTKSVEVKNIYIGEYKEREPDSNTIVYWKLNGDAKDSSGNHRDGTVSGNLTYESIGSIDVAKFTGSQEVYRSGSEFTLGGNHPFTFSVWIKPTSLSNTVPIATIQKSDDRGTRDKELVVQSNGSFYGYFYSGGANYIYDNTGEVTTSHWNYLTFTFNGSTLKLYLNGTLKNTVTPTSGSYTLASPKLVLSSYYYRGSYRYSGYMSNFILQNNAWDASYISNYFNTYKGLYGLS